MNFEDLAPELQEKARACKTPEDVLALAKENGYELSDAEIEHVSGGGWTCSSLCGDFDTCPGYY